MIQLTIREIHRIANRYIGVNHGYLGDFTYRTHGQFYPTYCDLDIDPYKYNGTTRERFIKILKSQPPYNQVKILRGILERFPLEAPDAPDTRTLTEQNKIIELINRLESYALVTNPSLQIRAKVVAQAIEDAEILLRDGRTVSVVDRVHTALYGYLRGIYSQANIDFRTDDSITRLLKNLRQHPAFQTNAPHNKGLEKILNAFSTVLHELNILRNHSSLAHPNETLLDDNEARLAINATWTILHYLDAKLSEYHSEVSHNM